MLALDGERAVGFPYSFGGGVIRALFGPDKLLGPMKARAVSLRGKRCCDLFFFGVAERFLEAFLEIQSSFPFRQMLASPGR